MKKSNPMKRIVIIIILAAWVITAVAINPFGEREDAATTTNQAIQRYLEDIDYMVYVLENNFPLLGVAYWARGVNYRELAANARASVLAMDDACDDTFLAIMTFHFLPLFNIGHFRVVDHQVYSSMEQNTFYGDYRGEKWLMNLELIRSPEAQRFYGDLSRGRRDVYLAQWARLRETYGEPLNHIWDRDAFSQPVTTESIVEGRIAYVSSGRSMTDLWLHRHRILNFYRQISDYEHLIIDMRGNSGGNINAFIDILLRPVLREPMEYPNTFLFFLDGPYVRRFGDILFQPTTYNGYITITEPNRPASEILTDFDLSYISHTDVERLHYGASASSSTPIITPHLMLGQAAYFDGKIWLLTDIGMVSAAQQAARLAKETGFITLVGETTGGSFGGPRTLAFMPNTGIIFYFDIFYITDSKGRPLEAGTIPHYFNRYGMDALETVLDMIGEWE